MGAGVNSGIGPLGASTDVGIGRRGLGVRATGGVSNTGAALEGGWSDGGLGFGGSAKVLGFGAGASAGYGDRGPGLGASLAFGTLGTLLIGSHRNTYPGAEQTASHMYPNNNANYYAAQNYGNPTYYRTPPTQRANYSQSIPVAQTRYIQQSRPVYVQRSQPVYAPQQLQGRHVTRHCPVNWIC